MSVNEFSPGAIDLFKLIVEDAADWSGNPGPNLEFTKEEKGYLTKLKKAGVLSTVVDDAEPIVWVTFHQPAADLAKELNIRFDADWVVRSAAQL